MKRMLRFLRDQLVSSGDAPPSDYRTGFQDALKESIEYAQDIMWEDGEDDDG